VGPFPWLCLLHICSSARTARGEQLILPQLWLMIGQMEAAASKLQGDGSAVDSICSTL
jgi:hypothetical protein